MRLVTTFSAWLAALPAFAQEFGGGVWRPSLQALGFYTDNFYYEEDGPQSATGAISRAAVGYLTEANRLAFVSSAQLEHGTFDTPGTADDYLDAEARMQLDWTLGTRHRMRIAGGFQHDHDPFGVDRTEDAAARNSDLDRWNRGQAELRYGFGAVGAAINAELAVTGETKRYITNESATAPLDYDALGATYTLGYQYSPKSSVLFEFNRTDYTFDEPLGTEEIREGTLYYGRLGARWAATAKTSGDVRVGLRRRSFDNGADAFEGADWQVGVTWTARPKTLVELRSGRAEAESYRDDARMIDIRSVGLKTTQTFTERLKVWLDLDGHRARFVGIDRTDETVASSLGLEYRIGKFLRLESHAQYATRSSDAAARDYDRVSGYIGVRLGR